MNTVVNILTCKCPKCEKGELFYKKGNIFLLQMPKMNAHCNECHFKFEKEPGFFFGAMFVNYGIAVAEMIASLVVFWHFLDLSPLHVFMVIASVSILTGAFNLRISKSIWLYMFYKKES